MLMRMRRAFLKKPYWFLTMALLSSGSTYAADKSSLPDEIQAVGGQGTAQSGAGTALVYDHSAIQINPAMLYKHKTYDVNGSYIWPALGRPFYKVAAIDGQTSKWTTAFEYTGFADRLGKRENREQDSPARRRAALAFAVPAETFSLGFAGHYVEAEDVESEDAATVKGFTLGAGFAMPFQGGVTFGTSVQNLNNKKVRNVAPRTIRAGLAWQDKAEAIGLHIDYRERERSEYLEGLDLTEGNALAPLANGTEPAEAGSEKMALIGAEMRAVDVLRFFVSGGKNVGGDKASVASGGIALFQKNFSLAYAVSRSYPNKDLQSSLSLSITMKL